MATDIKNDSTLSTSLISVWEMEESSGTRQDSHTSNNDLAEGGTGGVGSTTGKQGNAADFEAGDTDYLRIAATSQTSLNPSGNHSIGGWLYLESAPGTGGRFDLFSRYNNIDGNLRGWMYDYQDTGGTKQFESRISSDGTGGNTTIKTLNYTLSTATWYHVVFVYDTSGTVEVYVNGSSAGTMTAHKTSVYSGSSGANPYVYIGTNPDGSPYDGLMDQICFWNKQLSAAEASALYNSGSGIPYDAGGGGGVTTVAFNQLLGVG